MAKIKNFFLKNTGIRQTIVKNTFWLFLAQMIASILRFLLLILAVRVLGVLEYGKFTFAFSFVSVMVIFADLGIMDTATKDLSQDVNSKAEWLEFLSLDIVLTIFAFLLMIIGSFIVVSDPVIQKTIWVLSFFIVITSFFGIFFAYMRSVQKMEYESLFKIIQSVMIFLVPLFALLYFKSALGLAYGYLLANFIFLILFLVFFNFYFQRLNIKWSKNIFKILKRSWPLSVSFTGAFIYIYVASVILGFFNLIYENGLFGAAFKIAFTVFMLITMVGASFYPVMSKFFIESKENLQKTWNYLMMSMIFLAVPMVFGGITLSPQIIKLFYGMSFLQSIPILQFLFVVIAINLINYPFSLALVISNQQKKNFLIILCGTVFDIILSISLIQSYGVFGAVYAILLSSIVALFLSILLLKYFVNLGISYFNMDLFETTLISLFAGLLMFLSIRYFVIYNLNIFIIGLLGFMVYILALITIYKYILHKNLLSVYK